MPVDKDKGQRREQPPTLLARVSILYIHLCESDVSSTLPYKCLQWRRMPGGSVRAGCPSIYKMSPSSVHRLFPWDVHAPHPEDVHEVLDCFTAHVRSALVDFISWLWSTKTV